MVSCEGGRRRATRHDQRGDEDERGGEHPRADREGGRDAVSEQRMTRERVRVGRGEDGDQDSETERASKLVCDVRDAAVLGGDAGPARGSPERTAEIQTVETAGEVGSPGCPPTAFRRRRDRAAPR
jgi:hypothetical protein